MGLEAKVPQPGASYTFNVGDEDPLPRNARLDSEHLIARSGRIKIHSLNLELAITI